MLIGLVLATVLGMAAAARAQCAPPSAEVIGPGTPCRACWTNPTTNTDGFPLRELLTTVQVYLDPPATGPIISTTPPAFVAPISNGVAGATASVALCPNFPVPPATGPHTLSVSVTTASAQGPGSMPPLPFRFQGIPAGPGSAVVFR